MVLDFFQNIGKIELISLIIIIITLIGYEITKRFRIIIIGLITILAITVMNKTEEDAVTIAEPFSHVVKDVLDEHKIKVPIDVFDTPTPSNPFSNVLITDYEYNVNKKPAPPANNISDVILKEAKQLIINLNPTQPNIADKLFTQLGDEYTFEQSLRNFNSVGGYSTIPNDQEAFADFCYGQMISSKENNMFALARNKSNYNLY